MMAVEWKKLFYSLNLNTRNEKWKKKEVEIAMYTVHLYSVQCEELKARSPSIPRAMQNFLNQLIFPQRHHLNFSRTDFCIMALPSASFPPIHVPKIVQSACLLHLSVSSSF